MDIQYQLTEDSLTVMMPREVAHNAARHMSVFDFAGTEFMDSSGIGVLIGRKKTMDLHGGRVQAIHLSGRALQIFEKSGLTRIIELDQQDESQMCRQTQYFG